MKTPLALSAIVLALGVIGCTNGCAAMGAAAREPAVSTDSLYEQWSSDFPLTLKYCNSPIVIDTEVPADTRVAIHAAVVEWNKKLGHQFIPTPVDQEDWPHPLMGAWLIIPWSPAKNLPNAVGIAQLYAYEEQTGCLLGSIRLHPELPFPSLLTAARHEIGHMLGLPDDPTDHRIMSHLRLKADKVRPISIWEVRRVKAIHDLD